MSHTRTKCEKLSQRSRAYASGRAGDGLSLRVESAHSIDELKMFPGLSQVVAQAFRGKLQQAQCVLTTWRAHQGGEVAGLIGGVGDGIGQANTSRGAVVRGGGGRLVRMPN